MRVAAANAVQALRDENAVVLVELHDVGDGAEGDEVRQSVKPRLRRRGEDSAPPQFGSKRKKHVVHHAAARERLALKGAVPKIGVHDAVGVGQRFRGQVVVGDEDLEPQGLCVRHAFDARDAVVHRHNEVGAGSRLAAEVDDFGRKPVPELEAVGHHVACRNA